ncbi:probable purine permease 11 [Magnolia sinica]|uniref:probable purine permease 11 n=1 Tax=Magnolia sinica TaxID=86752 RepID=UPI00265B6713|nr:probable purine permease 11 [Magnolia sinica]
MGEVQELHLHINEAQEPKSPKDTTAIQQPSHPKPRHWQQWLLVALSIAFLLGGQSTGTLLGRFYYNRGGNSKWMATLIQSAGFPILLLPLFLLPSSPTPSSTITTMACMITPPSVTALTFLYVSLGLLIAGDNLMYSHGLLYLPVSTYSLICATQLAFNALFSFFLNSQKFTPYLLNSVVLLTFSASLLAVCSNSSDTKRISPGKYAVGFLCTLGASAIFSLFLSLTQLAFEKVMKKENFAAVLKMQIYLSAVATCACIVGLFASGDWRGLKEEMGEFGKGGVSYVMTLVWIAVAWQVSAVCSMVLIFEVSSLFCNVISTLGLPVIPILAVIFFNDKMDGAKVVAMLLAIWGFVSYIYQHYVDSAKSKTARTEVNEVSDASSGEK